MSKITDTSKSLSSLQEPYKTSYSYEIKELREKVAYWKRVSEIHCLESYYILGELYKSYMEKAMQELSIILQKEKQEEAKNILETRKPKKFFFAEKKCSMYQPVLSSFEILNRKEVEHYLLKKQAISQVSI